MKNYRPISLFNNLGKILDKIIFKNIYNYCTKNNYLDKYNFGFKKKSSCQHNLALLLHNIYEILDKGQEALVVYFDVVKAFDKVDHKILLSKLYQLGIQGIEQKWFKSYLSERFSKVVINGYESELYPINTSVTQGSVLATLLWSIFTFDMTEDLYTTPSIFADDTALVTNIDKRNIDYSFSWMQNDIDTINDWAKQNKLEFSSNKSVYMIISKRHNNYYPSLTLENIPLKRVRTQKQLGIYIDELLSWTDHINYVHKKCYKIINMLRKIRKLMDFRSSKKIFDSIIRPIIDYGSMFYNNTTYKNINKIDNIIYQSALVITRAYKYF